jgi:hypothetical protein
MPESVFRHTHRVVYSECTVGNHVYYARYLDMLEAARGEFMRQFGLRPASGRRPARPFPSLAWKSPTKARRATMICSRLNSGSPKWAACASTSASASSTTAGALLAEGVTRHVCATRRMRNAKAPAQGAGRIFAALCAIGIQVKRNLHAVPFDEHHVVVADVIGFAIGCVNTEWSERVFLHSISEFCYCNHVVIISLRGMGFKRTEFSFAGGICGGLRANAGRPNGCKPQWC